MIFFMSTIGRYEEYNIIMLRLLELMVGNIIVL